mmetsp:Transcript_13730/g.20214  ORF Transcript_13730/g.20214 Transcript_13730/m.20214 type:complete len:527 (-) Transcript_13730:61-1641(-)
MDSSNKAKGPESGSISYCQVGGNGYGTGEGGESVRNPGSVVLVWLCCICSSLTSILLGYDVGIMSGAIIFIKQDLQLTTVQEELVVGGLNVVAAVGGLMAGPMAAGMGRRLSISVACLIFILGAVVMTLSDGFASLFVGRVITGIGVGCGFVISPMYNSEVAPADIRGKLVAMTDIFINLGLVLGYVLSYVLDEAITGAWKWRVMLGIGIVPPFIILLTLLFLPESPRWLVTQHQHNRAFDVLKRIVPTEQEAKSVLDSIVRTHHNAKEGSWMRVMWNNNLVRRKLVLIVLGICFLQQATGSEAIVYYTPTVLQQAGISTREQLFMGAIAVGMFKLLGEVVSAYLVESWGRRILMNTSAVLSTVSMVILSLSLALEWPPIWNIISLCSFMWWFSFGIGPVTWVISAELLPLHLKAKAMSIGVFLNRITSGICATTFLSLSTALTISGAFTFYTVISVIAIAIYCAFIPETQGKSLEEIQQEYLNGNPTATPNPAYSYDTPSIFSRKGLKKPVSRSGAENKNFLVTV